MYPSKKQPRRLYDLLKVLELQDVPIWEVWLIVFGIHGGDEENPDANTLKGWFQTDISFKETAIHNAVEAVTYCLDEGLAELYEAAYPDGDMNRSSARVYHHALYTYPPFTGETDYYLSITKKGLSGFQSGDFNNF